MSTGTTNDGDGFPERPDGVSDLLLAATQVAPGGEAGLLDEVSRVLGARAGRLYVADYSLRHLQRVGVDGPVGSSQPIAGTLAGRAFSSGQLIVSESRPTTVFVPLVEGTERIGLLELDYEQWDDGSRPAALGPVAAVLVLLLVARRRYSDHWARARRSRPLSPAAEIQWDLLPPLSCSTPQAAVGGILEPAYEIGGDSFDYAINGQQLEFTIVDAVGHGMPAVLMAAAAINSLRNARRAGVDLATARERADRVIAQQFGRFRYVTAQSATLNVNTGALTWINAGHVRPMLVRNGSYAGTLECAPSRPLGLGGPLKEVATTHLQRGDRVLFFTDGIIEARSPDGARFGRDRLADFLVRAALEDIPVAETARRLSSHVLDYVDAGLHDDATLLLVEYRAQRPG